MTIANIYPDLSGKVVLVTGSSKALGAETARHFAQAGAKVVVNGRDAQAIEQVTVHILQGGFASADDHIAQCGVSRSNDLFLFGQRCAAWRKAVARVNPWCRVALYSWNHPLAFSIVSTGSIQRIAVLNHRITVLNRWTPSPLIVIEPCAVRHCTLSVEWSI